MEITPIKDIGKSINAFKVRGKVTRKWNSTNAHNGALLSLDIISIDDNVGNYIIFFCFIIFLKERFLKSFYIEG
ncbi:hypothetical protein Scep_007711 [Stephania cephalantha]|uniref:Uncharacterized protein n=1 Tax=Stephania cephalantha TaxID=152367 RepID=A0AAP0KCD3_9MAGN